MATAIPAAVGLGGSLIGGISGKGAAKKQQQLTQQLMQMLQPLIQVATQGKQAALQTGTALANKSQGYLDTGTGGLTGILKNFWGPLLSGNRSAIDQFLSPERRAINQGYQSTLEDVARFAPRGGGRVASTVKANVQRQGQLSDLVFGARRQAAEGGAGVSNQLAGLGLSGVGTGGQLQGGQDTGSLFSLLNNQMGLTASAGQSAAAGLGNIGKQLGDFLSQFSIFKGK